ncbi:hypothetical protein SAMN03097699_0031 [Flavobacteriaceae bacterium MAR_2010_188]|nr:hypothetical protein SAMN03097699_0031 [Flavobacteriaceae bacterium MAR_2010_188]
MLSFFRRTRRHLMDNNKTLRYIKYAVGEVLLVVIGILLALQLNNWKEQRNNDLKETEFLKAINVEFKENRVQFDSVLYHHRADLYHIDQIIAFFPIKLENSDLDSLSSHLQKTFSSWTFNPAQGSINSLLNTSSFNLIKNDSLRDILVSWGDLVNDYAEDEKYSKDNQMGPYEAYFSKFYDFDFNFNDPRFNQDLLQGLQFEFIIKNRRSYIEGILLGPEINQLDQAINKVIKFTEPLKN